MTDGLPTLPLPHAPLQNARLAVEAARRAADFGVRIDTFAIGPVALSAPHAAVEMARVTDGVFTAVEDPRDLIAGFARIRLAEIESVRVVNLTAGAVATSVSVEADGAFSALVPLRAGDNRIEVRVVTGDAAEARETISVRRLPGAARPVLSHRLEGRRTRLLERRLGELRQRSRVIRDDLAERVHRELAATAPGPQRSLRVEIDRDAALRQEPP